MDNLDLLLGAVDEAFDKKSWHGTNLKGAIRGLDARAAAFRPAPGRNSIQELVLHCAYWKYTVRRRLSGEKRGSFALPGSNFFARPRAEARQWAADVALLLQEHRALRQAIAGLDAGRLEQRAAGGSTTVLALLRGIAAHDLYHAGQIQLLKRLGGGRRATRRAGA